MYAIVKYKVGICVCIYIYRYNVLQMSTPYMYVGIYNYIFIYRDICVRETVYIHILYFLCNICRKCVS